MIQNIDFIEEFVIEAKEHLSEFDHVILKPVKDIDDMEVNRAFRAIHSIKGTAGFFALNKIVSVSHAMETVLDHANRQELFLSTKDVDVLIEASALLFEMVNDVFGSETVEIDDILFQLQLLEMDLVKENDSELLKAPVNSVMDLREIMDSKDIHLQFNKFSKLGHSFYVIEIPHLESFDYSIDRLVNMIEELKSVSNILFAKDHVDNLIEINESIDFTLFSVPLTIVVSSILRKDLFYKAIDLPADFIQSFDSLDNIEYDQSIKLSETDVQPQKMEFDEKTDSIRVNLKLLDELVDMSSELIIRRNRLVDLLGDRVKEDYELFDAMNAYDHLSSSIQKKVMLTRMQPVGTLFNKYPRVIYELAKKLNKQIELVVEGSEIELDRSILEKLSDPIVHLLRNAADHGIESSIERQFLGKKERGNILLKASQEGSYVTIEVVDDGKGLDAEKIRKKALDMRLFSETELNQKNEKEIFNLIFNPSFSTADKLSDVSGRGIGLDVVLNNIDALGGSIEINSKHQHGTKFKLTFPLTISVIQTILVWSNGYRMAIPQKDVRETIKVRNNKRKERIDQIDGKFFLRLRGALLPIFCLCAAWGGACQLSSDKDYKIVVLKSGTERYGVLVDELMDQKETLIKPLPFALKTCGIYSGLTIMGDGKITPIVDVNGLAIMLGIKTTINVQKSLITDIDKMITKNEEIILFKGFGNEMLGINISLVKRIEKINAFDIEAIGNKHFVTIDNELLRVIFPHDYLSVLSKGDVSDELFVIIPKLVSHPIGILAKKIIENVSFEPILDLTHFNQKGLFGATIYKDKAVIMLNLYELFEVAAPDLYFVSNALKVINTKVLLVEDSKFFQHIEEKYLKSAGYEVVLASDGKEALEILEYEVVDVILTDIQMPNIDGFELLRRIRLVKAYNDIPVVALTALIGETHLTEGLNRGFDRYEFKLDKDKLLKTLKEVVSKRGEADV